MTAMTTDAEASQAAFINALAASGNVAEAAKASGASRATLYRWRDGNIDFAAAWDDAVERAATAEADEVASDETTRDETAPAGTDAIGETVVDEAEEDVQAVSQPLPYPGARYRLTEQAFIHDQLLEPDAIVEYGGIPGPHMIAVNAQARAAKAEVLGYSVEDVELVTDFLNAAAVRRAELEETIAELQSQMLLARGKTVLGSDEQKAAARMDLAALERALAEVDSELAQIGPMMEEAQERVDEGQDALQATLKRRALEVVDPDLAKRMLLAEEATKYLLIASAHVQMLIRLGDKAWARVRLNSSENVAQSCVPDSNAVTHALLGTLLRFQGISLSGLVGLSAPGLEALPAFEGLSALVQHQNNALRSRLQ